MLGFESTVWSYNTTKMCNIKFKNCWNSHFLKGISGTGSGTGPAFVRSSFIVIYLMYVLFIAIIFFVWEVWIVCQNITLKLCFILMLFFPRAFIDISISCYADESFIKLIFSRLKVKFDAQVKMLHLQWEFILQLVKQSHTNVSYEDRKSVV